MIVLKILSFLINKKWWFWPPNNWGQP